MRYSICVIDNDIPASGAAALEWKIRDSALLNASNLQLLVDRAEWSDDVIRGLISTLLTQTEDDGIAPKWEVHGLTNPSFYVNAIDDGVFRSDVIVFDWEYPGAQNATETNAESILREILERTFCLIFIFSKADKKDEIDGVLAKPEFQAFKERLAYLDKAIEGADQTKVLLQRADEMYAQNFSFKFAGTLRRRSVQCADQMLTDMGKASLNDVKNLVAVGHGGKKDFVDFLAERFRTSIAGPTVYELVDEIPEAAAASGIDEAMVAKVWSYRLYFQQETGDDLVRRGDIVAVGNEVLLILSADCDLVRFWAKNLGIINAVALHELDQTNTTLKELLTVCVKPDLGKAIGSLLGKVGESEGPFVLPFVPRDGAFKHFVAIPKDLVSRRIATPQGWDQLDKKKRKAHSMKYAYWVGARRLCTVSEPFLTPVVQHVFNTVGGYGVPDYPDHMNEILKKILADFNTAPAVPGNPGAPAQHPPAAAVAGVSLEPQGIGDLVATPLAESQEQPESEVSPSAVATPPAPVSKPAAGSVVNGTGEPVA